MRCSTCPVTPAAQLEHALRIPALSAGWRGSFEALLTKERSGSATKGNAGLTPASGPPPAWRGFRPLRVSRKVRESSNVVSLELEPTDARPIAAALPGQFIVLRLRPASDAPPLTRSYSLSGEPSAQRYRVSVKREAHGAASGYVDDKLQVGDVVDASAARGGFTLRPGDRSRCFGERRNWGDPYARDAARAGGRSIDKGNLVAIRSP